MLEFQMARVTKDKCLEITNTFEPSKEGRRKGQLGIDGKQRFSICQTQFFSYLFRTKIVTSKRKK